jgi:proteasome lid subunit RPN8/RPN11
VSRLRLTRAIFEAIRAHGERAYPHECCGALLGRRADDGWQVESTTEAVNTRYDAPHDRYEIAPREVVQIQMDSRAQGLEIAGFYHSHPDHAAQWSETDLADAHWIGCSYVITAVRDGKAAETNSFCLKGVSEGTKFFEAEEIEVQD